MLEYQGHTVSLLWQSKQARFANARVCGLSQAGSFTTGGFVCWRPNGITWIATTATTIHSRILGSIPLYIIGYLGGEKVLRKRITEERFLRIHRSFEQHEFWALMFPGMLPPPMPFKIFVLAAAVFEMRFRDFLAAIFAGRFVRFLALSLLTLWFGPQIVGLMGTVVRQHVSWVLGAVAGGVLVWLLMRQSKKRKLADPARH